MPSRFQLPLRGLTDIGFWAKSLQIFNSIRDNGKQSIRHLARQTGFSKSSVHRLQQARTRRDRHGESWFWETEEGHSWLMRLVVATLYIFGLKRGVGADSISEFFCRLRLEDSVGCSPSALRGVMAALAQAILETTAVWEHEGITHGETRPIIGAVDETFLERLIRGLPKQRYKVWTVLHHFDCRAADGTTPASRFFRRGFPDLFETVLSNVDDLPRPRQRHQIMALSG